MPQAVSFGGTTRRVFPTGQTTDRWEHPLVPASVLLIDDDDDFRALARNLIEAAGLTVAGEADSVASARDAATALQPTAALVDVMLPDGDGVTLAGEMAKLSIRPRVLLTSSSPDSASESDVERVGAVGFVPKQDLPSAPLRRLLEGT